MLLMEWKDAENSSWLDHSRLEKLDEVDASILSDMKLTYQGGKGNNHLVPVLIPNDTIRSMQALSEQNIRSMSQINASNIYMFQQLRTLTHMCRAGMLSIVYVVMQRSCIPNV